MLAGIDISNGLVGWGETQTTTPFYFDHNFSFVHIYIPLFLTIVNSTTIITSLTSPPPHRHKSPIKDTITTNTTRYFRDSGSEHKADKIVLILSNRLLDVLDDIIYSTCIIILQYLQNSVIAKSSWKR